MRLKSQRDRALLHAVAFAALVAGWLLVKPVAAYACMGADFYECKSNWLDALYYPCIELNCSGLPQGDYADCRRECWQAYIEASRSDCSNCPA